MGVGKVAREASLSTDRQIAGLKPRDKPFEVGVANARGLNVRVFPTGVKAWEFRYVTVGGTRRRMPLGTYPALSLASARDKAAGLRLRVVDGDDPAGERSAARLAARTGETLEDLAEAYWRAAEKGLHGGRRRPKRPRSIENERSRFRLHIGPKLGRRPFRELRRADIKGFMRELATESGLGPASVGSVGGVLQSILGFAVHEDRLEANPCLGLTRPLAWKSRERMFSDDALAVIWCALRASSERKSGDALDPLATLAPETALALQLLVLTLCRRNEAAEARWEEFDSELTLWAIPPERAKAGHLHLVPLSPEARSVLLAAKAISEPGQAYVFPAPKGDENPIDGRALTRAVARLCKRHKLPAGSPHDVRRSGATTLTGKYGVRRFFVALVLGHEAQEGARVTSLYDRYSYLPEKREALEVWARHVNGLGV